MLLGSLLSCMPMADDHLQLPEPTVIYAFPYGSKVDAANLDCGYKKQEAWSDALKRLVRDNTRPLSIARQQELGAHFHQRDLPLPVVDHPRAGLVRDMVARMKPFMVNQHFEHEVYVVESAQPNAFTFVGGNIYVTTALLDYVSNEAELAYIIGHELGHNDNNHTKEGGRVYDFALRLEQDLNGQAPLISRIIEGLGGVLLLKAHAFTSGFLDQPDELEADIAGFYLTYQAGYDPEEALGGIRNLMEWEGPPPEGDIARALAQLFRSHPWAEDRYTCAEAYIRNARKIVGCGTVFPDGQPGRVVTRRDPLTIRTQPWRFAPSLGVAQRDEIITLGCACNETDVIDGRRGRWIYVRTAGGVEGWAWGHYLQVVQEN